MPWNHDRGYWGQCDTRGATCLGTKVGVIGGQCDTRGATCIGTKVGVSGVDVTLRVLHALEPR